MTAESFTSKAEGSRWPVWCVQPASSAARHLRRGAVRGAEAVAALALRYLPDRAWRFDRVPEEGRAGLAAWLIERGATVEGLRRRGMPERALAAAGLIERTCGTCAAFDVAEGQERIQGTIADQADPAGRMLRVFGIDGLTNLEQRKLAEGPEPSTATPEAVRRRLGRRGHSLRDYGACTAPEHIETEPCPSCDARLGQRHGPDCTLKDEVTGVHRAAPECGVWR